MVMWNKVEVLLARVLYIFGIIVWLSQLRIELQYSEPVTIFVLLPIPLLAVLLELDIYVFRNRMKQLKAEGIELAATIVDKEQRHSRLESSFSFELTYSIASRQYRSWERVTEDDYNKHPAGSQVNIKVLPIKPQKWVLSDALERT